jgi:hypothetical protein
MGRDSVVGIAIRYGLDGPRIESRWGRVFFTLIQTGRGTHPASYKMGTGSYLGVKRPGRDVDHPPNLKLRLKKKYIYNLLPIWAFVTCCRVIFTFTFTITNGSEYVCLICIRFISQGVWQTIIKFMAGCKVARRMLAILNALVHVCSLLRSPADRQPLAELRSTCAWAALLHRPNTSLLSVFVLTRPFHPERHLKPLCLADRLYLILQYILPHTYLFNEGERERERERESVSIFETCSSRMDLWAVYQGRQGLLMHSLPHWALTIATLKNDGHLVCCMQDRQTFARHSVL